MEILETIDDVKQALDIPSMRNMSKDKVMELIKLLNNGQISENAKAAIFAATPELVHQVGKAMEAPIRQAQASSNKSADNTHKSLNQTKAFLHEQIKHADSPEERSEIRDRIERTDEKIETLDARNKDFSLNILREHKEAIGSIALLGILSLAALTGKGKDILSFAAKKLPRAK